MRVDPMHTVTGHRVFIVTAVAIGLAILPSIRAHATEKNTVWFGIPLPTPLTKVHAPVVDVRNIHLAPALVPAEETAFRQLQGARIYKDVGSIVAFSKKSRADGNRVWGRVTGFPSAKATIEWSAKQLRDAGLSDVQVQQYDAPADTPMWWASDWQAKLLGSRAMGVGTKDVVLTSAVPASGSILANGSVTGELVFVGAINAPLPDVDVKGKIAVQHLKPANGAFSERTQTVQRAQELTKRGVVAVLNVVEQTGNMHVRDFGNCGAPCFNLGTSDGAFVEAVLEQAALEKASVSIRLELKASRLQGLKGHNAFGIVRGKSDENVIVNAHVDGWYDAAGDNADGVATLIALARHFAKPENKPERTLVFVASGGHHSTGLNGPANFVRMNADLVSKTVLVLNLEHIAQLRIPSATWKVESIEQPMNFGIDNSATAIIEIGKRGVERYGFNLNLPFGTSVSGDLGGYAPLGVARVQAIHSGPMYHTSGDVLETISVPGLERAARFYAYFIKEVAKTPRAALNPPK
jgi:Peptidase family M28